MWNQQNHQKPFQIDKIFRKEESLLKGCLNMEVDSQKRSDYLLLIQARFYGWSDSNADKAERLELATQTVTRLMNGHDNHPLFRDSHRLHQGRKAGSGSRVIEWLERA